MRRRTVQRAAIEAVFQTVDRALGVEEILQRGRLLVPTLNLATVYRHVHALCSVGWLSPVELPGSSPVYERSVPGHHHHFRCTTCARVFPVSGCALRDANTLVPMGFLLEDHHVVLSGTCRGCAG